MTETVPPVVREVTDAELEEAASRVRRHAWRERLAMGTGMLFGFAGIAGWFASGIVFVFLGGLFAGSLVYGALRPKHEPFEEPPADDPAGADARAEMNGQIRRGWLAWLAAHLGQALVARVATFAGLVLGLAVGLAVRSALGLSLEASLGGGAILGVGAGAIAGYVLGRRLARGLERRIQGHAAP